MANPTAGPWHAVIAPDDQPSLLYAGIISTLFYGRDGYVSVVSDAPLGMGEQSLLEECQANARLIAAAPLMFEALRGVATTVVSATGPRLCWCPESWEMRQIGHAPECDDAASALAAAAAPAGQDIAP